MATPIGFVGLGRMGAPMSLRLAEAGNELVTFDRCTETAKTSSSATEKMLPARSLGEVFKQVKTVVLMLPDSDAVESVLSDPEVLVSLSDGRTVIDMGSSEPSRTRALASRLHSAGSELIDAPVSGGVRGAETGSLSTMVGGSDDQFARCSALLSPLSRATLHAGPVGSGHAAKAINNLLSAAHLLASAEALVIAKRFGLEPGRLLEIVNASSGRSVSTEVKLPRFVLTRSFDSGFSLSLMRKDVGTASRLAAALGVNAPLARAVEEIWNRAEKDLAEGADSTEVARWVDRLDQGSIVNQ
jgi:3-hydroxyisobutyrate dehydrogenase